MTGRVLQVLPALATAPQRTAGPADSQREELFVATQPEIPVTALKAGQWVYLADRIGWFELARDAEPGFTVPVGGGTHVPAVRLHLTGEPKPLMFLSAAKLYARRDEEGN
jgi:hypothetical protein